MKKSKIFLVFLIIVILPLLLRLNSVEGSVHYTPEHEMEELQPILQKGKDDLTDEDYLAIFQQTGLGKAGVESLMKKGGRKEGVSASLPEEPVLYLQYRLFAPVKYECTRRLLVVHSERIITNAIPNDFFMPALEDGDILITFNGHFLGWRTGHAAIVVDAENGVTLEAKDVGDRSSYGTVEDWKWYPGFAVLRLKDTTQKERAEIALYAKENLVDSPYSLNVFNKKNQFNGTHCAHLVWQAFYQFGYDIDSNGGIIVMPADIFGSNLLEVVQVYGLPPRT